MPTLERRAGNATPSHRARSAPAFRVAGGLARRETLRRSGTRLASEPAKWRRPRAGSGGPARDKRASAKQTHFGHRRAGAQDAASDRDAMFDAPAGGDPARQG